MARRTLTTITAAMAPEALMSYHIGTVCFGLFKHPYKTMQDVIRLRIPGTVVLFPVLCWILGYGVLRVFDTFLIGLVPAIGFWWFLFVWGTLFFAMWQLLLLYLYWRFRRLVIPTD